MAKTWPAWRFWLTIGALAAGWLMACFSVVFMVTLFAVVALRLLGVEV